MKKQFVSKFDHYKDWGRIGHFITARLWKILAMSIDNTVNPKYKIKVGSKRFNDLAGLYLYLGKTDRNILEPFESDHRWDGVDIQHLHKVRERVLSFMGFDKWIGELDEMYGLTLDGKSVWNRN